MSIRYAIALFFVSGCSSGVPGVAGVAPSTAEEKIVAKHILETVPNPQTVKFTKWGPNDLEGKLSPPLHTVRVCYRAQASGNDYPMDMLYYLKDGKIADIMGGKALTMGGDNWMQTVQPLGNLHNMINAR